MTLTTLSGRCLCGTVQYSATVEVNDFYFCHCKQCRKITGSAFASNILTTPTTVNWITGSESVKRFDDPKRTFTKVFCSNCGSGLPFLNKSGSALLIPAGSLDEEPNIKPSHNIFWGDKAKWYEDGANAPKCDGFRK